ncbi:hypothetical protein BJX70DRAFT_367902 [Aspergillus crustosus]
MLFTKSCVLLLVAAATGAIAHPTAEPANEPGTTLDKRWTSITASLYSTVCGTQDQSWSLNDDRFRCISVDGGKDVYSIRENGDDVTNTNTYDSTDCTGDSELLYGSAAAGPFCYSRRSGKPFKSFMINVGV